MADHEIPENLLYTRDDEWIRRDGDDVVIGISDYAQDQLGEVVFVELPDVGAILEAGASFGTIESVKAVSDLFAPLSGKVLSVNESLEDAPEKVNDSCYGEGWLITLRPSDPSQFDVLLDAEGYRASIAEREDG
ncbi:MAG TPA: glycine cleavage system protein GcvH [Deltaproteobacteria bacterium]|nr:glycine cleavage system protein GcvH [Deltaproteobacteria bacterium]